MKKLQMFAAGVGLLAVMVIAVSIILNPAPARLALSQNTVAAVIFGLPSISITEHPASAEAGDFYHPGPPASISWESRNAPPDSRVFLYLVSEDGEDRTLLAVGEPPSGTFVWTPKGQICVSERCDRTIGGPGSYTIRAELYTPSDACYGQVCPGTRRVEPTIVARSASVGITLTSSAQVEPAIGQAEDADGRVLGESVDTVGTPGGLTFTIHWDPSVASAPVAFKPAVRSALSFLGSNFGVPITLDITVGWGTVGSYTIPLSAAGQALFQLYGGFNYETIVYYMDQNAKTLDAFQALSTLPEQNPDPYYLDYNPGVFEYYLPQAQMKALGFGGPPYNYTFLYSDGRIGFNPAVRWCYDQMTCSDAESDGETDLQSVVMHEVTHLMGRTMPDLNHQIATPYELFDYRGAGVRNMHSLSGGGYFSIDSGTTALAYFTTLVTSLGDWNGSISGDAFNSESLLHGVMSMSEADFKAMDILGYQRILLADDITPPSVPTLGYILEPPPVSGPSSYGVFLSWNTSTDPVIPGQETSWLAGYNIYQNGKKVATSPTNSYTVTGIRSGTTNKFAVSAYDNAGNISPLSNTVTVTIPKATGKKR
jgi:hypothetical protein